MFKKILLVTIMSLFCFSAFAGDLEYIGSHDPTVTAMNKTGLWNPNTSQWTPVICTVSKHVLATHDGDMNGIRYDTTLGNNQESQLLIYGPDDGEGFIHILWDIDASASGQLNFYYTNSWNVTPGASIPIGNHILGEAVDAETTAFKAGTIGSFGNNTHLGGTIVAGQHESANFTAGEEILLNSSWVLIVELCSLSATNVTSSKLHWHRVPDGELP